MKSNVLNAKQLNHLMNFTQISRWLMDISTSAKIALNLMEKLGLFLQFVANAVNISLQSSQRLKEVVVSGVVGTVFIALNPRRWKISLRISKCPMELYINGSRGIEENQNTVSTVSDQIKKLMTGQTLAENTKEIYLIGKDFVDHAILFLIPRIIKDMKSGSIV